MFKWHRLGRLGISNLQYVARLLPLGICCLRISATECSQANQPLLLGQPFKSTIASCAITISATMHSNHPHSYCSDKLPALCHWWQHVIWTKEWILKANEVKVDFGVLLDGSDFDFGTKHGIRNPPKRWESVWGMSRVNPLFLVNPHTVRWVSKFQ